MPVNLRKGVNTWLHRLRLGHDRPFACTNEIMRKSSLLLFLCVLLASCGNKSESEIQGPIESGVVLVQSESYYEVLLPSGATWYFSSMDEDGNISGLTLSADSIGTVTSYGTGFFVSEDGKVATNCHVVSSRFSDKEIQESITGILDALKAFIAQSYAEAQQDYGKYARLAQIAAVSEYYSYGEYYEYVALRDNAEREMEQCSSLYYGLDRIRASDCQIRFHNEVGLALNDTYVTNAGDFLPCVVTKTDGEHDLAIIQLKDKRTPEGRYVFRVPDVDPLATYSFMDRVTSKVSGDKNSRLCMCGFNRGPALALTSEGVKSQFNTGAISQTQDDKLMYSIPALPGSSGSPVVNMKAELVAINFAGLADTQSFNYGIRVRYLRQLLDR